MAIYKFKIKRMKLIKLNKIITISLDDNIYMRCKIQKIPTPVTRMFGKPGLHMRLEGLEPGQLE
jgi:hypothetical protein